ncbi:HNH endonuclease [Paenibacillus riograndensis]|uniref:HNH endonuclease n=1 Tax=Paenibacillus riograndensis TaxID=483937 RepID=UPI000AA84751|nr:HNH endonuclease [Paenibacillus riograndensis]
MEIIEVERHYKISFPEIYKSFELKYGNSKFEHGIIYRPQEINPFTMKNGSNSFGSFFGLDGGIDDIRNKIKQYLLESPELAQKFTKSEIALLKEGKVPKTLTWHHHQDSNKMQIIDYFEHQVSGHTGGRAIWGGGRSGRKGSIKNKILEMFVWE